MKLLHAFARIAAIGLFCCVGACGKGKGEERAAPAPSHSAVAEVASAPPSAPSVLSPSQPPEPTCRALRVEGEAMIGQVPLVSGALVDGSEWVTLGKGASLTLKHSSSGREFALGGPALFRACRRGREQVLLA